MDIIELDEARLEIAQKHFLEGISYRELGRLYHASPSTIQRRLTKWLREDRFELRDKSRNKLKPTVIGIDEGLGETLVRKTGIWRARVARISGLEESASRHSDQPAEMDNQADFKVSDEVHRCLGEVGGELLLHSLRKSMTIGLSSGRGVGFTIEGLSSLAKQTPSWARGFESIHLISLCGGTHVGMWEYTNSRDFDADENVFAMASLLKIPRQNVSYMTGPVSVDRKKHSPVDINLSLDLAVIGLGELNIHHPYFRDQKEFQLKAMAEPIRRLIDWQAQNPELLHGIAEIVLRLYPVGNKGMPPELMETIRQTNETILTVPPDRIRKAGEIMLIAGGRQKLNAILGVLGGKNPDIPIEKTNLTLITDAWTADQVIRAAQ